MLDAAIPADLLKFNACGVRAMRRAARAVTQFYQVRMRKTGLRATQFTILNVLAYQEATIKQIADYLTIERSSVTRALAPLKRDGFVTGRRGEDARERILMLTGKAHTSRFLPDRKQQPD